MSESDIFKTSKGLNKSKLNQSLSSNGGGGQRGKSSD
jgi:hypothetical protein